MFQEICKFKNPEISYICKKALDLSIVYSKCGHEYKKIFKEEDSIKNSWFNY